MSVLLAARVAAGAHALDEAWARDGGWAGKIDAERLDMSDSCDCVLGQLYDPEGYLNGVSALNISGAALVYGFTASPAGDVEAQWPELRRLWLGEIERRLAA